MSSTIFEKMRKRDLCKITRINDTQTVSIQEIGALLQLGNAIDDWSIEVIPVFTNNIDYWKRFPIKRYKGIDVPDYYVTLRVAVLLCNTFPSDASRDLAKYFLSADELAENNQEKEISKVIPMYIDHISVWNLGFIVTNIMNSLDDTEGGFARLNTLLYHQKCIDYQNELDEYNERVLSAPEYMLSFPQYAFKIGIVRNLFNAMLYLFNEETVSYLTPEVSKYLETF